MPIVDKFKQILAEAKQGKMIFIASAIFALVYHIIFLFVFWAIGLTKMMHFNFFSVSLFTVITIVTPRKNEFSAIYVFFYIEVITHQLLAYWFLGGEASFQYLILLVGILPILSFGGNFVPAMSYGFVSISLFIVLQALIPYIDPHYDISPNIITVIRVANIGAVSATILFGLALYAYIVWHMQTNLEQQVADKTKEIEFNNQKVDQLQNHIIRSLASLVESRDTDTGGHIQRTSEYVELLARKAYQEHYCPDILNEHFIDLLKRAAPMHDIGKIVVPDSILKKPGRFTPEEFEQMKMHTIEGSRIINDVIGVSDDRDFVEIAADVATYHHERWDGTGYPYNRAGDDIPLSARIMAVADVFDALVSPRCYKDPMTPDMAFSIIEKEAGTHFDPTLAKLFLSMKEEILIILTVFGQ
ncbi:MAG: HD domain-containing protein [Spirochaetales bacterium]|nr:HD domain-containing protein [Spirochaetales bacterium]MBR6200323.1 HD domain-containing protein [Spirochaetales bacterium]